MIPELPNKSPNGLNDLVKVTMQNLCSNSFILFFCIVTLTKLFLWVLVFPNVKEDKVMFLNMQKDVKFDTLMDLNTNF